MSEYIAKGTLLKKGTSSPVTIANIMNITPPNLSRDALETTKHNDSNRWRTFIPGLVDPGEVKLDITWDPAETSHDFLTDIASATIGDYSIVFPDTAATTWTFKAFVTGFEPSGEVDGLLSATVTFKLSGPVALAGD